MIFFLPKGRGGSSENRARQGGLKGMRYSGEFSSQEECDATRCNPWVQGGEGHEEFNLGSEVGAADGGDFAQAAVPGFLDVWKVYDSLDRVRCVEILRG